MMTYAEDSSHGRGCYLAALFVQRMPTDSRNASQRATFATRAVVELQGIAKAAKRAAECACSYPVDDAGQARADRAAAKRQLRASEIVASYDMRAEVGGDPRGCCCTLFDVNDDRAGDGWGGGYGVW